MMSEVYKKLAFDPFAVAHRLQMPAALFEAFKKSMLGGKRGKKSQKLDYLQAIECVDRYLNDWLDDLVRFPIALMENKSYIQEVTRTYAQFHDIYTLDAKTTLTNDELAIQAAYMAGIAILSLFSPETVSKQDRFDMLYQAKDRLDHAVFNLQ